VFIDDDVEKAVHQRAHPVLLAAEFIEARRHGVGVVPGRQPHGDEALRQHEPGDSVSLERRFAVVGGLPGRDRVHREEGVRPVHHGFGAFGLADGVLDRPAVQVEFLREVGQRLLVGIEDVAPDQGVVLDEVVRD
jgi:hypothetical protein